MLAWRGIDQLHTLPLPPLSTFDKNKRTHTTINPQGGVVIIRVYMAIGAIELHHTLQSMMICSWKCHAQHLDCLSCIPLINVGNKLKAH